MLVRIWETDVDPSAYQAFETFALEVSAPRLKRQAGLAAVVRAWCDWKDSATE